MSNSETILVTDKIFGIFTCIWNALKKTHEETTLKTVEFLTFGIHLVCHININKVLMDLNKNSSFLNQ